MAHPILQKLLDRAEVRSASELSKGERAYYDQVARDLERIKPPTIREWEEFIADEIDKTIDSYRPDDSEEKKNHLLTQLKLLKNLLAFLQRSERGEKAIKKQFDL